MLILIGIHVPFSIQTSVYNEKDGIFAEYMYMYLIERKKTEMLISRITAKFQEILKRSQLDLFLCRTSHSALHVNFVDV